MVKIVVGLMGSSVATGSAKTSSAEKLRPFLEMLKRHGIRELDTARVYNAGKSEQDLGDIPEARDDFSIATKAPGFSPGSLSSANILANAQASLEALKQSKIDLYYFHGPDRKTALEESCRAIQGLHDRGWIGAFGVSNYTAEEVEEIHAICEKNGWVLPSVYQGIFNPLARESEKNLFPTLRRLNMAFYAFSPLAGGFFSRPVAELRTPPEGGRMDQMKHFKSMFVNETSLKLHDELTAVCEKEGVTLKAATLRWLKYHSIMGDEDAIILGGSSTEQMEENLQACEAGPLPESLVKGFEELWTQFAASQKT